MAAAAASDDGGELRAATPVRSDVVIYGLDPGIVNMGLCEYNVTRDEAVSLERVEFRQSGTRTADLGCADLIESVSKWILDNRARFSGRLLFIEDQHRSDNREVHAVQFAFQAMFGREGCTPVAPASVKARYPDVFPRHPKWAELEPRKRTARQYAWDKRNAVLRGRELVSGGVRKEYEEKNPRKKDDAYDAFWIARYAAEHLINLDTGVRERRVPAPAKRRRKADGPHPRPRPRAKRANTGKGKGEATA